MEDTLIAKIVSMCLLGGVSLLLGILPIKLADTLLNQDSTFGGKSKFFISALNCFGAGVILTTCLTHMLPEVNHFLQLNIQQGLISDTGMPLAEIFFLCGFFMIYIVEEIVHFVVNKWKDQSASFGAATIYQNNGHVAEEEEEEKSTTKSTTVTQEDDNNTASEHLPQLGHHEEANITMDFITAKEKSFQVALRGFLVILALSLHAVFEGIAVGLGQKANYVWYLFFAIAAHKFIIAFCVGMQLVTSGVRPLLVVAYMSTFALITPIGIGIGIALTETVDDETSLQNAVVTVLQGLAAGTLLYVVFFEVLEKERLKKTKGLVQVTFIVLGFVVMILVQLIEANSEEGGHHHGGSGEDNHPICQIQTPLTNLKLPVNVTCENGVLTVI